MEDNVLVVGKGGREHTLAWKIAQSDEVREVFVAPGNAGMRGEKITRVDIGDEELDKLAQFAYTNSVSLTVVGPEAPLAAGITDFFRGQIRELAVFGPGKNGAMLEASKVFAREMMRKYGIPYPLYRIFKKPKDAVNFLNESGDIWRVIKADGLCAGKGVDVTRTLEEAIKSAETIQQRFGNAAAQFLVEERVYGEEASILALTDGRTIMPLISSQDHKRAYDNDEGPNTGGMGAYAPAPVVTPEVMARIEKRIFEPTLKMIREEGIDYRGVLYFGLMIVEKKPYVLEINVRFGDPEIQPIVAMMKSDLYPYLLACVDRKLCKMPKIEWHNGASCCVVMASKGYPGKYEKGKPITGLDKVPDDVIVFHAGTALRDGRLVTDGGRVLGVTGVGNSIKGAIKRAYDAVGVIHFGEGEEQYRTDIGAKARGD